MALTLSGDGNITGLAVGGLPPNVIGAGAVLQVIQATTSTIATTTSTSFTSTDLSASITPSSASSKILILITAHGHWSTSGGMGFGIYRNASPVFSDAVGYALYVTQANSRMRSSLNYLDSPSTTSSTTYTLYFRSYSGGSVTFCEGNNPSSIILMEISG